MHKSFWVFAAAMGCAATLAAGLGTTGAATAQSGPSVAIACPSHPVGLRPIVTGDYVYCGVGPEGTTGLPRSFVLVTPPVGYNRSWDDDRLNPYRGLGTPAGEAQMRQIWSNTVPRRLITVPIRQGHAPSH